MKTKEQIQEDQYTFPYHYITETGASKFNMCRYLQWGLVHASYIEFIKKEILKENPKKILDAGCGDGRILFEIEKILKDSTFTGIDISERALLFAKGFTQKATFLKHDIITSPTVDTFDLCISIEVIEHIHPDQIRSYLKNIAASLAPNGTLILSTPTTNIPTSKKHYQHFTELSLRNHLEEFFVVTEVKFQNQENKLSSTLSRLLINKFFIINHQGLKNFLYGIYIKWCFEATENSGSRIYLKAQKR